jgi:fructose-1,6-bisphosphatase II
LVELVWACITTGEKDEAPMLYCGERIGCASEPQTDIAVDPLDGTTLVSQGRNGAIAVIAVAERGALFDPGPCMYMEKVIGAVAAFQGSTVIRTLYNC